MVPNPQHNICNKAPKRDIIATPIIITNILCQPEGQKSGGVYAPKLLKINEIRAIKLDAQ